MKNPVLPRSAQLSPPQSHGHHSLRARITILQTPFTIARALFLTIPLDAHRSGTVHVFDLGSAKGTYVDQGSGWKRVSSTAPSLLPAGGRVRLGDCPTRLLYPAPPADPTPAPAPAPAPAPPLAPDVPQFSSLLTSTIIKHSDSAGATESVDASAVPRELASAVRCAHGPLEI